MVNRGPRKVLDVNAPKRARQKPGPKPKPKPPPNRFLHDPASYVAPARKRPIVRYADEQIVEVLQYLYYHKILDKKPDGTAGEVVPRYRSGTILQKRPELFVAPEGHRYRSPTYDEAADWFQIPKGTIIKWWNTKLGMIGIEPEVVPQAPMPDFLKQPRPTAAAAGQLPLPAGQQPLPTVQGSGAVSTGARSMSGSGNGAAAPGPAQVTTNGLDSHAQTPDPMQDAISTAQGALQAVEQQASAQLLREDGEAAQSTAAEGSPAGLDQPVPNSVKPEAGDVSERASTSDPSGRDTATPAATPSDALGDASNFDEEMSSLGKEMSGSEEEEVL